MTDLVEFLRARLDADAQAQAGDSGEQWHARFCHIWELGSCTCDVPKDVLTDVEAKRQLVEWAASAQPDDDWYFSVDRVLALLALPYADHPDYREEWKP